MTTLYESTPRETSSCGTPRRQRLTHEMYRGKSSPQFRNVGEVERIAAGAVGASLLGLGLKGRSPSARLLGFLAGGALVARAASGYCPLYDVLGIQHARLGGAQPHDFQKRGIHVQVAITIDRPAEELYRFWRNFENLPRFMQHLVSVTCKGERDSHWVAKGPAGSTVEWDAQIINEEPNRLIAWRSLEDADVDNAGSVRFVQALGGRGTVVQVTLDYIPPAGRIGQAVAKLFGEEPKGQIHDDLRRFKQLMELGEIVSNDGQPRGTCR